MSAHTPGPWKTEVSTLNDAGTPHCYYILSNATEWDAIASTWSGSQHAEGDARLIAAAPDLLAALDSLFTKYVVELHGEKTCDCDTHVTICAPCLARAALAKAKVEA